MKAGCSIKRTRQLSEAQGGTGLALGEGMLVLRSAMPAHAAIFRWTIREGGRREAEPVCRGTAGALLLERLPTCRVLSTDKDRDRDAIGLEIEAAGDAATLPPAINRARSRPRSIAGVTPARACFAA